MNVVPLSARPYEGHELHHCYAYEEAGILGPTITHFRGPADVKDHLVDLEDVRNDDFIKSEKMAHFIIEIPNISIQETVVWQRLFIRMFAKTLDDHGVKKIAIRGDDIMVDGKKLSVSIATLSRFSGLIHVGINVDVGEECPVDACGLSDFGIIALTMDEFFTIVSKDFATEYRDILMATYKVTDR